MRKKGDYYTTKDILRIIDMSKSIDEIENIVMNNQLWLTKEMHEAQMPKLSKEEMIERIKTLEEEIFYSIDPKTNALNEAQRLVKLIIQELKLDEN